MQIHRLMRVFIISFCLSTLVIAEEIDYPYSNEAFSPCGIKKSEKEMLAAATPETTEKAEINYVSGGVCAEEVNFMKGIAQHFSLEIVVVQQENDKEIYIADAHVSILNAKQEVVLDVVTEGPFLFVNLPDGKYTISASYHDVNQTKQVNITKKHSRLVFVWKDKQAEATSEE